LSEHELYDSAVGCCIQVISLLLLLQLAVLLLLTLNKVGEAGTAETAVAVCFDCLVFLPPMGFTAAAVTSDEAVASAVLIVTAATVGDRSVALLEAACGLLLCVSCWRSFSSVDAVA
jgi:hypothetical protein